MTAVSDFSNAISAFFEDLEALALDQLADREAALIGAVNPHLEDLASPLRSLRDDILAAVDGLNVADEAALTAALVDAISNAGIDGVSAEIDGSSVRLVLGTTRTAAIDGSVGLSSLQTAGLGLAVDAALDLNASAELDLALLFDPGDGPSGSLNIEDNATADDVQLTLSATLDGDSLPDTLTMGVVQADIDAGTGDNGAEVSVGLDLEGGQLGDQTPEAEVTAEARLALGLDASFGSPFLPGIEGTLVLDYGGTDDDGLLGLLSGVSVQDITLGVDAIDDLLDQVLGPLDDIANTFPLGPVIDLLSAPLPVIDDLAGFLDQDGMDGVTLLDLLTAFGSGDQDYAFVETIVTIGNVLGALGDLSDLGGIELGDISFNEDALNALLDGSNGVGLSQAFDFAALGGGVFDEVFAGLTDSFADLETGGLVFPLLSDRAPEIVGQILFSDFLQTPAPLVEFILPEFGLDREQASFEIAIPVGPFAAVIEGGFEAIFRVGAGISTNGLLGGGSFGDSLYLTTARDENDDLLPLAEFNAFLAAGIGVRVPGVRVTVGGGILGEIDAYLGDNDSHQNDGMSHVSDNLFPCIFDPLTGALSAGLNLTFSIGAGPFEFRRVVSFLETQIVDFSISCSELDNYVEPIVDDSGLASLITPARLRLNSGDRADLRAVPGGNDDTIDEVFHVRRMTQYPADGEEGPPFFDVNGDPYLATNLQVDAFGISEVFAGASVTIIRGDGGDGNDTFSVQQDIDIVVNFFGGDGNDTLVTGAGDDLVEGGAGNDIINTGAGDDLVRAGAGDDVIRASEGADRIDGDTGQGAGSGIDQVDYSMSDEGVELIRDGDAVFGSGGLAEGDVLTNVEYLIGTQYDDILSGDDLTASTLDGEGGNDQLVGGEEGDLLIGGAGADLLIGRGGNDIASYVNSFGGVQVDLTTGFAFGSDATGDVLDRVESLQGSMYGDTLIGDSGDNLIDGFAGDDLLEGRGGQDDIRGGGGDDTVMALGDGDTLDGGGAVTVERDRDLLSYQLATSGVVARLASALYDDDLENDDTILGALYDPDGSTRSIEISSFEDLRGSDHDDDLGGDYGNNRIEGGDGDDTINAFAGNDVVAGGEGDDDMQGGLGNDWLDYSASDAGVTVSLAPDVVGAGGHADGDTVSGFENIIGSDFADTLTGDEGDNIFDPLGVSEGNGVDDVDGEGGVDTLRLNYSSLFAAEGLIGGIDPENPLSGEFSLGGMDVNPQVTFAGIERFEIHGTMLGDILLLGDGDDRVWAGAGNDIIASGLGGDIVFADDGDDLVFSQIGETLGTGGGGAFFYLDGGAGFDGLSVDLGDAPNGVRLIMHSGTHERDDQIVTFEHGGVITGFEFIGNIGGTAFDDELRQPGRYINDFRSGGGDDILAPGLGFDAIDGGETANDPSLLTDADLLILDYSELETGYGVLMTFVGEGLAFASRYEGLDPVLVDNMGAVNIEYAHITGTSQDDTLYGIFDPFYDEQGDIMRGLDGDDVIQTFNGNDSLFGGAGSDTLIAGDDDDRLQGGLAGRDDGTDRMRGDGGADVFVLGDSTGLHYGETVEGAATSDFAVIEDFVSGQDQVQLVGSSDVYDLIDFGGSTFVRYSAADTPVFIARLDGVTGLDLESSDFSYVIETGGPGDVTSRFAQDSGGALGNGDLAAAPDDVDPNLPAFEVTQGEPDTNLSILLMQSLAEQGIFVSDASISVERTGDARAFGNFQNGLGLDEGVVISTGKVEDLPGLNTEDGGVVSHLFGGLTVDLQFERIGVMGEDGSLMTFYRANLADVPFPIASLTLRDDDDGTGGDPGSRSGADIAGLALTTLNFNDIETLTGGDLDALQDQSVFPTLDLFDFSALNTFFTQGSMRSFNPDLDGGGGFGSGDVNPADPTEAWGDTDGAVSGFVDNARATLGVFDYDASSNSGYLSLGDGGQLGLNLTDVIDTDDQVWLIVAEAGGSEGFDGTFTASTKGLIPAGDLSTDFGAPGAEDDTITYAVEFTADLGNDGGPVVIGDDPVSNVPTSISLAQAAYVKLFDAVLASEELREFSGTELQDSLSIKLNGVEIGYLSDGAAASLDRLSTSPVGPYHDDLVLNLAEDAVDSPLATRADGYTLPFSVEGYIVNGVNRLEITIADQRDGYLDTALLLSAADGGPEASPEETISFGYFVQEDSMLTDNLPNSIEFPYTYSLPFGAEPSHGSLELSPDGGFTYTPDADFYGEDSFVYLRTDEFGGETYQQVQIQVTGVDDAPVFVETGPFSIEENQTQVGAVLASDPDGDVLTYALNGGADAAAFAIDADTGNLTFLSAPDYEAPTDSNGDNSYVVRVTASDGISTVQSVISVDVGDVDETPITVINGGSAANTLVGTDGVDHIFGHGGGDILFGDLGDDLLDGGQGDDDLRGGGGNDQMQGGAGADLLRGGTGLDNLSGGFGNDDLRGGGGVDALSGDRGNDQLVGEAGRDILFGGAGNDVYIGGGLTAGGDGVRDVFVFKSIANGGGGLDVIRDFEDGIDRIDLSESNYTAFGDVLADATGVGTTVIINFDGGGVLRINNLQLGDLNPADFLF